MDITFTIPTDEQVKEIQGMTESRNDWTALYDALSEHGKVIVPELPIKLRNAVYTHYRNTKRKVHFTRIPDSDSYLLVLRNRE